MDMNMIVDFSHPILHPFQSLKLSASSLDFGVEFASNKTPGQLAEEIDRIIKLHEAHKIEMFRLHLPPLDISVSDINNWIEFAVAKGVQVLELNFSMELGKQNYQVLDVATAYRLPDSLYRCNSIAQLSLNYCNFHPPIDSISFTGLQSLSLTCVSIRAHVLETMIDNSPQLASLSLVYLVPVHMDDMESIKVLGQELRRLAIINCYQFIEIEICAPKLRSFIFYGEYVFGNQFSLDESSNVNVPMLEDAFISSYDMECTEPEHDYLLLLSDIRHVKILTVCPATLMRFHHYQDEELLPLSLSNLRELQLLVSCTDEYNFQIIWSFLKLCHTPILEKLFIRNMWIPEGLSDQLEDVQEFAEVVFSHLRIIKMSNFLGTKLETSLVGFLLQRAVCLENLVLVTPKSLESIRRLNGDAGEACPGPNTASFMALQHQISVLPKASPNANVILVKFEEDDLAFAPTHQEYYDDLY